MFNNLNEIKSKIKNSDFNIQKLKYSDFEFQNPKIGF